MTFTSIASVAIVPPANLTGLALVGLAWRRRAWGRGLAVLAMSGLFVLSLPVVADTLRDSLQDGSDETQAAGSAGAIVVLGAELLRDASPAHDDAPGPMTLQRLREAAAVARQTGLPVLVSGGVVDSAAPPVGNIMALSLAADFGITPRWIENRSATTWENAQDSAAILRQAGISTVLLVTHDWHMRRAMLAFAQTGLIAIPRPTLPLGALNLQVWSFLPSASAWVTSYDALHEWIGLAWYGLRAGLRRG